MFPIGLSIFGPDHLSKGKVYFGIRRPHRVEEILALGVPSIRKMILGIFSADDIWVSGYLLGSMILSIGRTPYRTEDMWVSSMPLRVDDIWAWRPLYGLRLFGYPVPPSFEYIWS